MQKYSEYIERVYQDFLIDYSTKFKKLPDQHLFLYDLHRVVNEAPDDNSNKVPSINHSLKLPSPVPKDKCSIVCDPPITEEEIQKLYEYYQIPRSRSNLSAKLAPYINKCLQADKKLPKEATILIIGGGPAGMYAALYAKQLLPNASILVIDNYIVKEGLRKPFSRMRNYSINEYDLVYTNIYVPCWREFGYYIRDMEFFLYIHCKYLNIKFAFTKKYNTWKSIHALSKSLKTKVIIDATGGRLTDVPKPKHIPSLPSIFPKSVKMKNKDYKIAISPANPNEVILLPIHNKKYPKNHYYLAVDIFKNNKPLKNLITDLKTKEEYNFWKRIDNQCLYFKDLYDLKDPYVSDILSWFKKYAKSRNIFGKFRIFDANLHHALTISRVISPDLIYIGIGDTIFHSHFYTGAGLGRTLFLVRKILNPLPYILNQS